MQNSVFEWQISEANLAKLKVVLKRIINEEQDSVIIYNFRTIKYSNVEKMRIRKGGEDNFP